MLISVRSIAMPSNITASKLPDRMSSAGNREPRSSTVRIFEWIEALTESSEQDLATSQEWLEFIPSNGSKPVIRTLASP